MERNDWYGVKAEKLFDGETENWTIKTYECASLIAVKMRLWLRAYKQPSKKRFMILVEYGMDIYPMTIGRYKDFVLRHEYETKDSSWILLDYLLVEMKKELAQYTEYELDCFVDLMHSNLSLTVINIFTEFIESMVFVHNRTKWRYQAKGRNARHDNTAYSLENFSIMAYCIFNEDYWQKEDLIKKACSSEKLANVWLFLAIHFISALRATDIKRLPKPELPYKGEVIRNMIMKGEMTNLSFVCDDLKIRMKYGSNPPHKTENYQNISDIKIFIPTSLEKPFGIIFAIAASYHDDIDTGKPFIQASARIPTIKKLFGQDFVTAVEGKDFSTRRANKAYMQGLELSTTYQSGEAPKGYMIAALARSHKGSIGTFPEMTKVYLKDANFSGYSPEFIIREMFERGVFGFIPHVLLQIIGGETYDKMPVSIQTDLIQQVGLTPMRIDETIALVQTNLIKARETVKDLIFEKESISSVIQKIASGSAVSKSADSLCLSIAGKGCCTFPNREVCSGCKYEIYTKSTLHIMVKEYVRMQELVKRTNSARHKAILKERIVLIIQEFLETFALLYPDADIEDYTAVLEGGLRGYDYGINANSTAQI